MIREPLDAHWMRSAACRGADTRLFFPERGTDARAAKQVCAGCPVCAECLTYALSLPAELSIGVWGGTSARERRRMRRRARD